MPGMMSGMMKSAATKSRAVPGGIDSTLRTPRRPHPDDLARNKAIEEKLDKVVAMNFPNETPLEDVLKYIKESTADAKGKTIPIYVSPKALQESEKTMTSPVTIDLEDIPLRTTLRLLLDQIELRYLVRDGILYITNGSDDEDPLDDVGEIPVSPSAKPKPGFGPGGMGRGLGGGGFR